MEPICDRCQGRLGARWWQKVPDAGNLCDPCHEAWLAERPAVEEEKRRRELGAACPVCSGVDPACWMRAGGRQHERRCWAPHHPPECSGIAGTCERELHGEDANAMPAPAVLTHSVPVLCPRMIPNPLGKRGDFVRCARPPGHEGDCW